MNGDSVRLSKDDQERRERVVARLRRKAGRVRENALSKGRRYAAEGRLVVRSVDGESARAECRGDGATYQVGFDNGRWFCSCPALGRCSISTRSAS
jgi:hypothetical protein